MKRIVPPLLLNILLAVRCAAAAPWSISVVDEHGAPLRAQVFVSGSAIGPHIMATDAAGHASGDLLASVDRGEVLVYAAGHAAFAGNLSIGEQRVVLGEPHQLPGRVLDENGRPLAGIAVSPEGLPCLPSDDLLGSVSLTAETRQWFMTKTDAAGRYVLRDLPAAGEVQLGVNELRWQHASGYVDLGENVEVPDLRTTPGSWLSGRVLKSDGTALQGVQLYATCRDTSSWGVTDVTGHYRLGGLPAGTTTIKVWPTAVGYIEADTRVVTTIGHETVVPDIRAAPGALLEVTIDPPTAGCWVTVMVGDTGQAQDEVSSESNAGTVSMHLRPGKSRLYISPPAGLAMAGRASRFDQLVDLQEGKSTKVEAHIVPDPTIRFVARDEAGRPLAGVAFHNGRGPSVVSDADGNFTLNRDNLVWPYSTSDGYDVVQPKSLYSVSAVQPVAVTLRKIALVPLRGRVIDNTGAPIAGATVAAGPRHPNWSWLSSVVPRTMRYAVSGADGGYEIDNVRVDDDLQVRAAKPRHLFIGGGTLAIRRTIVGEDGKAESTPTAAFTASDLVLLPLLRVATGRVLDAAGRPVEGALVAALGGGRSDFGQLARNIARTDAEGRFRLSDLPAGRLGFVAGAGAGFAQICSETSDIGDLVLQTQPAALRDLALGAKVLRQLIASSDMDGSRVELPLLLAPYDLAAAFDAARQLPAKSPGSKLAAEQWKIIDVWTRHNPGAAPAALPALLARLPAPPGRVEEENPYLSLLVAVAGLLPHPELKISVADTANMAALRAFAWHGYAAEQTAMAETARRRSPYLKGDYRMAWLAVLAARLRDDSAPIVAASALKLAAATLDYNPHDISQIGVIGVFTVLAQGGADLIEKCLPAVPPQQRWVALGHAIEVIAPTDLQGAQRLLELMPAQPTTHDPNYYPIDAFGMAVKAILREMRPADAEAALVLADRVDALHVRPEALALAARLQPPGQATPLFREAFLAAGGNDGGRTEQRITAIAIDTDTAEGVGSPIGTELSAWLIDRLFGMNPSGPYGGSDYSICAFDFVRVAPGWTRAWLEWKWAIGQNTADPGFSPYQMASIATAMSAVDPARALEMASSIPAGGQLYGSPQLSSRQSAERAIARYLLAPESVRRKLYFTRSSAGDSWSPQDSGNTN